ncbi:uncharacterized protein LOC113515487 [Galleria mellonella]|uniref:Uncharacterized protein LOC113515487 n=1 Tax=Galleria mellonella TaxID=7137 RepID=A0A6J1WL76_GALME|nr:uncharacterized protein LOC113515487 [Galleria mellonella]XP_052749388.1 uncharacterized protein LOC113515487 [Galleria mellonella]
MAQYQSLCLFVTVIGIGLCHSQSTEPVETTRLEENTLPSLGREVEDNSRYKTLEANATLLKLLVNDKQGVSKTEVFDMLHSRDDDQDHIDLPVFPEDTENSRAEVPATPDSQVEFLQAETATVRKDSMARRYSAARGEPVGTAAGIMVVITCSIVCLGYTGLIVWRRIYMKRNGLKHELLRNEENIAETRIEL